MTSIHSSTGSRAVQWLDHWSLETQSRDPRFEFYAAVLNFGQV